MKLGAGAGASAGAGVGTGAGAGIEGVRGARECRCCTGRVNRGEQRATGVDTA